MKFPFQRQFTIESPLLLEVATSRLADSIGPARPSLFQRTREPFTGAIRGDRFDIMRTTYGRNSMRAHIQGRIESGVRGTSLRGTMKVHQVVVVFFALVVLGPGMFMGGIWLTGLLSGRFDPFLVIFPAGSVLLLVVFGRAFNHESRRALRMLADILEAERWGFESGR